MLGVNVAKSSLHLHFLKTLEFSTDVSVTSMAGVAEAIRLATSHPPSSTGMEDLRHKATTCPNPSTHPIPFQSWSLQNDLWAAKRRSTCLSSGKGQISLNSPKPVEKAAWPCASLDPWGSDGGAEPTCQVQCFCFVPL
uniref:Uncharacterized protein n=1 Tax=Castor canadensis TaxID=51338 RepID=A0A8C0W451_CASCN